MTRLGVASVRSHRHLSYSFLECTVEKIENKKLANTVLYLLERCGSQRPGKQALLKMLWYADYWHYREHLSVVTDAKYLAMPNGPVIENYLAVFEAMEKAGFLELELVPVYGKPRPKEEYHPKVESDPGLFAESELAILEKVIAECAGRSGTELSRRTHREGPWLAVWNEAQPNQPIHRSVFRWLDNLPDENDCAQAERSLERPETAKFIAKLRQTA